MKLLSQQLSCFKASNISKLFSQDKAFYLQHLYQYLIDHQLAILAELGETRIQTLHTVACSTCEKETLHAKCFTFWLKIHYKWSLIWSFPFDI